jgi:hypothetical protein
MVNGIMLKYLRISWSLLLALSESRSVKACVGALYGFVGFGCGGSVDRFSNCRAGCISCRHSSAVSFEGCARLHLFWLVPAYFNYILCNVSVTDYVSC